MNSNDKKIQIASFDDTTVVGINSVLPDHKLAWSINQQLTLDLVRYDDLVFEGIPFAFFYYTPGENYNVYNLVGLVNKEKVFYPFKPRLDYLLLIQHAISPERQVNIMRSLRAIDGIGHAFLLEKNRNLQYVLETIAACEQQMIDKKKKQNDLNEIRKHLKLEETQRAASLQGGLQG